MASDPRDDFGVAGGRPFAWAPDALEEVTFGQSAGLACASYAEVEIWVKTSGHAQTGFQSIITMTFMAQRLHESDDLQHVVQTIQCPSMT